MRVANHRQRNDPGCGGADALQEPCQQQKFETWSKCARDRTQRIERDPDEQGIAPAEPVGDWSEKQLRAAKADNVGQQHELHLIGIGNAEAHGYVGKSRQHDVDRQRVQGHQRGDDCDELRAADACNGRRRDRSGSRFSVH